jgi:hypothetical protein
LAPVNDGGRFLFSVKKMKLKWMICFAFQDAQYFRAEKVVIVRYGGGCNGAGWFRIPPDQDAKAAPVRHPTSQL